MQDGLTRQAEQRLFDFLDGVGNMLGDKRRRASFATYAIGLLGEGERKSAEPIAARSCGDPKSVDAAHQRLLHFLSDSEWDDSEVRVHAARYATAAMTTVAPIEAWIIDDTGFLKQGTHSVGVQRQYTGSAGKIANCQVAVSLTVGTGNIHHAVDFELYLPESWLSDPERRREARIPEEVVFRTKIEIADDILRRAVAAKIPQGVVLADSFYGDATELRTTIRELGLHYAVGISYNLCVWPAADTARRSTAKLSVREIADRMPGSAFRKVTWRAGTKGRMSSRFAFARVVPCHRDGKRPKDREQVWLVIEWEAGEAKPNKFFLASLPESTSKRELVRTLKQRWGTERVYEDLKGELGLDHFEGRRYRGWQHHVSTVLCCAAFVTAERCRVFPPSGESEPARRSEHLAA